MKGLALVAVVAVVGCGPAWEGRYAGILGAATTCSDGSSFSNNVDAEWTISEQGNRLSIATTGACSPIEATFTSNVATIQRRNCPRATEGDVSLDTEITGDNLRLRNSGEISVRLSQFSTVFFQGTQVGTCTTATTGSVFLERQG